MISDTLNNVFKAFDMAGFELRIVGGAVRDHLLGEEPKDTDATPTEMEHIATINKYKFIPTGIDHGTVTLVVNDEVFEVTTLRVDVETDGRHAEVEFTRSFEQDAARRDLTINAMSMDRYGTIFDYFGGEQDLMEKRIRFVGNPIERIQEDYLRILRFFRFAARFGGIENSRDQIQDIRKADPNGAGLKSISVERYWLEMQKLLVAPYKERVLLEMYMYGILEYIGLETRFTKGTNSDAIGELSNLLRPWTIDEFLSYWKLSSDESNKLRWLVSVQKNPPIRFERIENFLVDGIPKDWMISALMVLPTHLRRDFVAQVEEYDVPVFPVKGQDLLDMGLQPGPLVGKILNTLREEWKVSRFALTKEQLLKD